MKEPYAHRHYAAALAVDRIAAFFESFQPADLPRLGELYTDQAYFKDPFNEVSGLPALERIYAHMFDVLDSPRFRVTSRIAQADECFLAWEFRFRFKRHGGREHLVRGGSHLRLAPDGRIASHRDYWDAAEEVWEKVPLFGALMRWLKRRATA